MRHGKKRHQLNRFTSWHKATMRGMSRSILLEESIHTTLAKAKAAKSTVEKLIGLAKQNDLASKRRAFDILQDHRLVVRLFSAIGPRFKDISGGYTRIISLGRRRGDDAQVVIFELTRIEKKEVKRPRKKAHKAAEETPGTTPGEQAGQQKAVEEKKQPERPKPTAEKKPSKKFLGGIRKIFKKERDSL